MTEIVTKIQQTSTGVKTSGPRHTHALHAAKISVSHTVLLLLCLIFLLFVNTSSASASSSAAFVGFDTTSQGNWGSRYGADGYAIAGRYQNAPAYASFSMQGQFNWIWEPTTSDARALQTGSDRTATTWYSWPSFSMDLNIADGGQHTVAIYAVDWDQRGRSQTFQIVDATSGAVLDTRSISDFKNGIYAVWNITGHVKINVIITAGCNGVVSGVFFGSSGQSTNLPAGPTARFLSSNTSAQGKWQSNYGSEGYFVVGGAQNVPSYALLAAQNQLSWTWAVNTSDPRAPQGMNAPATAATWYNGASFSLDLNIADGKSHQVALYAVDWDLRGRSETIQIVDFNSGQTLDSQSVTNFSHGVYMVWSISGHVKVNITNSSAPNAVISGVFFGSALNPSAPNTAIPPAITTQPVSQTITAGQEATFSVADTGSAPITYQWMKNGAAISGANSSSCITSATSIADQGSQFTVTVSNSAGSTTSAAAVLTVNPGTLILNVSSASLSFGNVNVSSSGSQSVTVTNAGTANVVISNVTVSGAGYNATGLPSGTVLGPNQTATLNATFAPAAAGNSAGSITIASNATGGAKSIALSGSGTKPQAHNVSLTWSPSTSGTSGYNVYMSSVSGSGYAKLTSSPVPTTDFVDSALQSAQSRYYVVTSVGLDGQESAYSSEVTAIVP